MSTSLVASAPITVVIASSSTSAPIPAFLLLAPITLTPNFGGSTISLTPLLQGTAASDDAATQIPYTEEGLTAETPAASTREGTSTGYASDFPQIKSTTTTTLVRSAASGSPATRTAIISSEDSASASITAAPRPTSGIKAILAGIVIAVVVGLIAVGILVFLCCNKTRRKRTRESGSQLRQVGVGAWIRSAPEPPMAPPKDRTTRRFEIPGLGDFGNMRFSGVVSTRVSSLPRVNSLPRMRSLPRISMSGGLGLGFSSSSSLERGTTTSTNTVEYASDRPPSEQQQHEHQQGQQTTSTRGSSWMPRVSRLLARAAAARSNTTTTASSRSRRQTTCVSHTEKAWTASRPSTAGGATMAESGDWDAFVRQNHPGGLTMPAIVNVNERSFLESASGSITSGERLSDEIEQPPMPSPVLSAVRSGVHRFSRASAGTFGFGGGSSSSSAYKSNPAS